MDEIIMLTRLGADGSPYVQQRWVLLKIHDLGPLKGGNELECVEWSWRSM